MSWPLVPMPRFFCQRRADGGGYASALCPSQRRYSMVCIALSRLFPASFIPLAKTDQLSELIVMWESVSFSAKIAKFEYTESIVSKANSTVVRELVFNKPRSAISGGVAVRWIFDTNALLPSVGPFWGSSLKKASRHTSSSDFTAAVTASRRRFSVSNSRFRVIAPLTNWAIITPPKPITPTIAVWKSWKRKYAFIGGGVS